MRDPSSSVACCGVFYFNFLENILEMKNLIKNFSAIVILSLLLGCTSTGNQHLANTNAVNLNQNIVNGQTTKAEIEALLGSPDTVDLNNDNNEKWVYEYKKSSAKGSNYVPIVNMFAQGTNDFKKMLVIVFNKKGIVQNHAYSESKGETNAGIVG